MHSRSIPGYARASDFKRSQIKTLFPAIQARKAQIAKRNEKIIIAIFFGLLFAMLIFSELIN